MNPFDEYDLSPQESQRDSQNKNQPSGNYDNAQNNNASAWDYDDLWGNPPPQNPDNQAYNQQQSDPFANTGGSGGFDFAALRGATKPADKPSKPFHLDSMSLSYFEKEDFNTQQQQNYVGQDVLNMEQSQHGYQPQKPSMYASQPNNRVEEEEEKNDNAYDEQQYQHQHQEQQYQQQEQQYQEQEQNYQQNEPVNQQNESFNNNNNNNQAQAYNNQTFNNGPDAYSEPYSGQQVSPGITSTQQTQPSYGPIDTHFTTEQSPGYPGYNSNYDNVQLNQQNQPAYAPEYRDVVNSQSQQGRGIQKSATKEKVSIGDSGTRKSEDKSPMKSATSGNQRVLGNEGETLDIQCNVHKGQYIERICVHPLYTKKRLLCWECSIDEAVEIQKYRHSLLPISQYLLQNIEEYSRKEGPEVPGEFRRTQERLEETQGQLNKSLVGNVQMLKESLEVMKKQVWQKFSEMEKAIEELAKGNAEKFERNKEFFNRTLAGYYPDTGHKKTEYENLVGSALSIETEAEFYNFVNALKPEVDPSTKEVKNYLRVLSQKVDNQDIRLPSEGSFKDVHARNVKVVKLQEQILTNLEGIKGSLVELVDSAYEIEDISRTKIGSAARNLTLDNMSVTVPINKVSNELLRYRLNFEKNLSTNEAKSITCLVNIDNEIIAAGSLDKSITFWRISTSEVLETILAHDDAISGLYTYKVCLGDLKSRVPQTNNFEGEAVTLLVSTGGKFDNSVLFWDISWMHEYIKGRIQNKQQSKLIRRLEGHESGVTAVLPMVDGATMITGAHDGRITVWNVLKSKVIGEVQHHQSVISCMRLMRCNERFASASWDKTISIWRIFYKDLYEGKVHSDRRLFDGFEMETIIDPSFKVNCINASNVMKNWLVFGGTINRIIVWDVDEGRLVKELECEGNNLADCVLVEDEQKEKMVLFGICDDDDVIRGWDMDYYESEGLIREAYNLKNRKKIYASKTAVSGSMMQLVQDSKLKVAVVNAAEKKDIVTVLEVRLDM